LYNIYIKMNFVSIWRGTKLHYFYKIGTKLRQKLEYRDQIETEKMNLA